MHDELLPAGCGCRACVGLVNKMSKVRRIIIFGTGGTSRDIADTLEDINSAGNGPEYRCVGFLDDDPSLWGQVQLGVEVLGPLDSAGRFSDCHFVNGIGSPESTWRKKVIIAGVGVPLQRFETIVHPSASVSDTARLGAGTVVFQNVTITSRVHIGEHVMILPNAVVSHDAVIGDYTAITGGVCISGGVRVGESCYLGTNSTIIGNVSIGDYSQVGMGSVVLHDVPPNTVVVGNPARFLRHTRPDSA